MKESSNHFCHSFSLNINNTCSYESNIGKDPEKERVKPKFASTILFVEDYLETVVKQDGAFADRKQNKLTYEVRMIN